MEPHSQIRCERKTCLWMMAAILLNRDLRRNQSFRIEGQNGARFIARVRRCMYYFKQDTRRIGFELDTDSKKSWVLSSRDV